MTNHLWQSTLFALAAGLLTIAFRKNRAHVRYWLWFSASVKFLAPFSMLMSAGALLPAPAHRPIVTPSLSFTIVQISEPFTGSAPSLAPARDGGAWLPIALLVVWGCGFGTIVILRWRDWRRVRAAVRVSTPIGVWAAVELRSAPGLLEPGVVGLWRPVLLLPEGIAERLTAAQLEAVLAHELCHVRRRDNVFATVHMAVETLFWFHPLVWWIGARLVEERERACDEAVLTLGAEPHVYAEGILNVCKLYAESPLVCVSGVTGSDLKRRVHSILSGGLGRELNFARKLALALAGAAALAVPLAIGMMHAPSLRAQSAPPSAVKFEVASVKPCNPADPGTTVTVGPAGAIARRSGGSGSSPGRLEIGCAALADLIRQSYISYGNGHLVRDPAAPPLVGGPDWIRSAHYMISAKTAGAETDGTMAGPAMQALLEDRFQLKVHRENREVPVYILSVARNGTKLKPFQPGSCVPGDVLTPRRPDPAAGRNCQATFRSSNGSVTFDGEAVTLDVFCRLLTLGLDRPAIDKTGITGLFHIRLEFARDENTPGFEPDGAAPEPAGPSIFGAIQQQLGMKLEPGKGPREFLVIDRVQRPTEN